MKKVRSENTKPEMMVRRLVYSMGYRYRLHRRDLPGAPDLVFSSRRKIIFVNGCFWHGHNCRGGLKRPKANKQYWSQKLARNQKRDLDNQKLLLQNGWDIMILWECELSVDDSLKTRIRKFLNG